MSTVQILIILAIVIVIFGTKKLKSLGSDLGGGISSFKKAMKEGEDSVDDKSMEDKSAEAKPADVVDAKVEDATEAKSKS